MKNETTIRGLLALSSVTLCILLFFFLENERKFEEYRVVTTKQIDSLTNLSDSLHDEDFNKSVELGRHELTRDYFFERHKNLQMEYENYLNHETE